MTVNLVLLVAVPPGVVTAMAPVLAPVGTMPMICVAESTLKLVAAVPLNLTEVVPLKSLPVTVTLVLTGPEVGVKLAIAGARVGVGVADAVTKPASQATVPSRALAAPT
jgi:hypothetical protein